MRWNLAMTGRIGSTFAGSLRLVGGPLFESRIRWQNWLAHTQTQTEHTTLLITSDSDNDSDQRRLRVQSMECKKRKNRSSLAVGANQPARLVIANARNTAEQKEEKKKRKGLFWHRSSPPTRHHRWPPLLPKILSSNFFSRFFEYTSAALYCPHIRFRSISWSDSLFFSCAK